MPYIQMNTNIAVDCKQEICRLLAEDVTMLTGKSPLRVMAEINDNRYMYFALSEEPCMKIKVELFHSSELSDKEAYAAKIMSVISSYTGISVDRIYLNFEEFEQWGNGGTLK